MTARELFDGMWNVLISEYLRILAVTFWIILNISVGYSCSWPICILFYGGEILLLLKWMIWVHRIPVEKPVPMTIRERNYRADIDADMRRHERKIFNRQNGLED